MTAKQRYNKLLLSIDSCQADNSSICAQIIIITELFQKNSDLDKIEQELNILEHMLKGE